jgi:adenylyltransferase/sulfurtransferase
MSIQIIQISATDTKALLDSKQPVRLIDCREPNEWALCHIEGAELIPLSTFAGDAPVKLQDKAEPIVIYCHAGVRSARAAHYLQQLGFTDVRSMTGGIDAWSTDVDPSVARY